MCKLIVTDTHDLVFGVTRTATHPQLRSPQPRNGFRSAYEKAEFLPNVYYETLLPSVR